MFDLGIITDEATDDFERGFELAHAWGLRYVELRQGWGKNVLQLGDEELDRLQEGLERYGLSVTAIASPVFKSPLDEVPRDVQADFALAGVESMEAQLELLERACELAVRVGAPLVRIFTFWREPWTEEVAAALTEKMERAARVAQKHGVTLAVENEPVCIVGTGRELGRLCVELGRALPADLRPHVGALWDPGNALSGGEADPYPGGYAALGSCRLLHVHLKDLVRSQGGAPSFVPLGQGDVDFAGQLRQLRNDRYSGVLVLETHYAPPHLSREEAAYACVAAAREVLLHAAPEAG